MPQPVLAIEFDASEIKAAVIEASFRESRVLGLYREAVVADGSSLADQLRRFVEKHELPTQATVLSALPGDVVTWRRLRLPFRDRKRLEQTVPFELESQVPFGLDEVVVDYHVLSREKEGSDLLAGLVPREELQIHLHTLEEAGLDPKVVDVAPLACVQALALADAELPADFVLVTGNQRRVVVARFEHGALAGIRTIVATVEAAVDDAEEEATVSTATPDPDATFAELRWTLVALLGGPPKPRTPCLMWGEGEFFESLGEQLDRRLGFDVRPFAVRASRRLPAPWNERIDAFAAPLGLALREALQGDVAGLNFRRGEFSYHRSQDEFRAALWRTAALAAGVLAVILANTYSEQARLSGRATALQAEISEVFRATLPDARAAGEPVAQLRRIIEEDQKKLTMLGGVVPIDGATAVDTMRELAVSLPSDLRIEVDEFTMDSGEVRIRATSDSFETVDVIKQRIEERNYFGAVEVKNVKSNRDGGVGFLLLLSLGRVEDA